MHDIGDIFFADFKEPHASVFTQYLVHILLGYQTKYLRRECPKDLTNQVLLFNPHDSMRRMDDITISKSPSMRTLDHPTNRYYISHQVVKIVKVDIQMTEKGCPTATAEEIRRAVLFASKGIFVDIVSSTTMNDFFIHKMRTIYNYKTKVGVLEIYYYSLRMDKSRLNYTMDYNPFP